jgi:transcriptional regulator with XRE-family HTH domain
MGPQTLVDEFVGDDPERVESVERACADLAVGVELNRLRTEAGLSTRALAALVGTKASVISRIEQADYEGHSLAMLRRVASALGRRVVISFPPADKTASQNGTRTLPAGKGKGKARVT